jgi:hypothetical protein
VGFSSVAQASDRIVRRSWDGISPGPSCTFVSAPPIAFASVGSEYSGAVVDEHMLFPNPANNALYAQRINIGNNSGWHGWLPGAYFLPHRIGLFRFFSGQSITGVQGLPGRTLRASRIATAGVMLFDCTGPWFPEGE